MFLTDRPFRRVWTLFQNGTQTSILMLVAMMGCSQDAMAPAREPLAQPAPAQDQESWRSEVTARIRDASRSFEPTADGYRGEVVERGLTGTFEHTGVSLAFGADVVEVATIGWGRDVRPEAVAPIQPTLGDCVEALSDPAGACIRRLEYAGVDRTEWWVGGADGFQQGWTVETREDGGGDLAISIAVHGADVTGTETALWLQGDAGGALVVDGLAAWDADGAPLDAHFTTMYGGFRIHVADALARYPITIDPVYTTPSWQVEGAQADDFGSAVAGAGDVNGDGYDDVIVGAPATTSSTGSAYVFLGSAAGVSSTADATLVGESAGTLFGGQVAGAGDVNDDGYDDVIVGAIGYNEYRGRASVFLGSGSGISTTPATTLDGGASSDYLGTAVAAAGDVNNDGYSDVIVGAGGYGDVVGQAYVFHGSASGVSTAATTTMTGEAAENYFAWTGSLSGAGDVNNDGYDDVIVGAAGYDAFAGRAYVYLGSSTGVSGVADLTLTGSTSDALGSVVSRAGDVDDDGYDDVIVGARGYSSFTGRAYVHHGSAAGVSSSAALTLTGSATGERFGDHLAGPGDVNNDGYDDVAVGASAHDVSIGRVDIYLGSPTGISGTADSTITGDYEYEGFATVGAAGDVNNDGYTDLIIGGSRARAAVYHGSSSGISTTPVTTVTGIGSSDGLGISVSRAGDVDNDGYDDVIVGASGYLRGTGRAYVFTGSAGGLSGTADTTIDGLDAGGGFGTAVGDAGDVDNDGFDDVIVGACGSAPDADSAYVFLGSATGVSATATTTLAYAGNGCALSGAGDVNGDGYDDVIVGNFAAFEAFVYLGSPSGVSSTAATTLTGSTDFGISVSDAGDVNDDGYGDVIVGASGVAAVFHGTSSGVSTSVATVTDQPAGDGTNRTVSAAGDVNSDGYDDVIVGAPTANRYATYRSRMFIYLGAPGGVSATEATNIEGGLLYAYSVSAAGDVDNDGYDDVIVGAPPSYGGAGVAYVYLGSAAGLSATVDSELTIGESDYDQFGVSVSGAGDVNNDGYGDVIVGAPSDQSGAGRAHVFDGYTSATPPDDDDGDGYDDTVDCDDSDPVINPAGTEVCDEAGADEDCDTLVDDADPSVDTTTMSVTRFADADNDTYGAGAAQSFCDAPSTGTSAWNTDCEDTDPSIHPGAVETCDGIDHDCDGLVDDADPDVSGTSTWYADNDGDGHGDVTRAIDACAAPAGTVASSHDCLDTDAAVYPDATEVCNAIDDDCDTLIDDADPSVTGTSAWYADSDGDAHGDPSTATEACEPPVGTVASSDDCVDTDAAVYHGANELCNDIDDDCDGLTDDDDPSVTNATWYADTDGDGSGDPDATATSCFAPVGYVANAVDCDDTDADVFPTATERAGDAIDQNCDGVEHCYVDADGDGYTSDETTVESDDLDCDDLGEALATAPSGDCDDAKPDFHPEAPEPDCEDPRDYNCDGSVGFADTDGDGFAACKECDDAVFAVNPDAVEVCNGVDDDCDGTTDDGAVDASTWYADADADGYTAADVPLVACDPPEGFAAASATADCDDADATVSPNGDDVPDDGIDQDCSGEDATTPDEGSETGQGGGTDEPGCDCDAGAAAWLWAVWPAAAAFRLRRRGGRSPNAATPG